MLWELRKAPVGGPGPQRLILPSLQHGMRRGEPNLEDIELGPRKHPFEAYKRV